MKQDFTNVEDFLSAGATIMSRRKSCAGHSLEAHAESLLTLQPAMSRAQLTEMQEAKLQLIVPAQLHRAYDVPDGYQLLSVEEFVQDLKRRFSK